MAKNDSTDTTVKTEKKDMGAELVALQAQVKGLTDTLAKTRAAGVPSNESVFGGRNVRVGEDINSSRGFSFMKMLGLISGQIEPEKCKIEIDMHNRLNQAFVKNYHAPYEYRGAGQTGMVGGKFLAPLASSFFPDDLVNREFRNEMRERVSAGTEGADIDETGWIRRKMMEKHYGGSVGAKTLSWLNELTGGALVAPPEMGELIELLRNKEALVNAGARVVPLPPQGRIKYPRQTAASSTYWVGENAPISASDIGTGEVTLQAKKLTVLIKAPNELIRFASPAAEALMRDDMTKSLALGLDLAGLEGFGGDTRPLGIINMQNITRLTSSVPGANGDQLVGQDIYRMIAAVEEGNSEFESFVMRPKTLYKYYQLRADSVAQGDSAGPYLFNLIREAGDGTKPTLGGYPVVKSTQVSQVRSKGDSSNLTYVLGGMFSDLLIGMFGAIEFAATTLGDTAFTNDQTWIRGILSADIQARHEISFVLLDNLAVGGQ